eukprot:CAMPEP_0205826864 /NCGR_PEP_ID=MMETSP0206-20130828/30106_1 /ASSEMBLY_ACC=CAM_ASM_000279 /TAXON_ID=36767 /ORGANISM="Euplotes focardii, Strain TN1" /LENGTH=42 /DNA_ID= /DNA_START= /DNA_END= /DNA_ORIENTATION=
MIGVGVGSEDRVGSGDSEFIGAAECGFVKDCGGFSKTSDLGG